MVGADGQSPVLSYAKLRALLACLAIERGNELERSWLAGLLWPEFDEAGARQNLRRALSNLRAALNDADGDDSCFRISRSCISLNPSAPIDIDVADIIEAPAACESFGAAAGQARCRECLLRMETVVGRYRGELLPGFSLPDAPEFEQWLSARRETLHRHVLLLLDRLAACHSARGDHDRALPFGLRRLDLDPWDEAALRRVMSIYVAGGQASAALHQFQTFRRELESELGILPDRETQRLAEEIVPAVQRQAVPDEAGTDPERRQVTIVCCQLSPPDDGEGDELIEALPALRQQCEGLLREAGGYTLPAQGCVLAYFGYPKADEHAPRLAVGAALAVMRAAAAGGVSARIGVHTALVLSDADSGTIDVAGTATGVAMAVPQLVASGTVALTAPTCRLVAAAFDCEPLGNWRLGGARRALGLFRAAAAKDAEQRLQRMRNRLAPFVGREAELLQLEAAWRQAVAGERRLMLLSGEAGIGKSRLAQALVERVIGDEAQLIELACQPEGSQEALHPVLACIAAQLDCGLDACAGEHGDCLAALAGQYFPCDSERVVELGQWLLAVRGEGGPAAANPGDDGSRRRMLTYLLDLIDRRAERKPLLILAEDVHWADPSSRELLELFHARPGPARILLLATARPDFAAPEHWPQLRLPAMPEPAVRAMVGAIAAGRDLPESLVGRIVEFSDGVPLFVEETTRMMLKGAAGGHPADIPHSLRDLLASRLDALGEAKAFAQHAAVLGRRFAVDDVAWLMALPADGMSAFVERMEAAGLISREGATCQFRHALIREAAYQSLPPTRRKALHRRAAEMLRQRKPQQAAQQPGLVAHHYTAAGEIGEALEFHQLAADLALRYSAFREHVWHLRQALAQVERLRASDPAAAAGLAEPEIRLLGQLGWAVGEVEGLGSMTAREIYNRAFELCRHAEGGPELFRTLLGLWRGSSSWSSYARSLELGEQLLAMAGKAADPHQRALACYTLGNVHCALGNLETSVAYLRQSVASYRPEMPVADYGDSAGVGAHAFLGWAQTLRGFFAEGQHEAQRAVALARSLGHPPALCFALIFAAETHRLRGEVPAAVACATEAAGIADTCGIAAWRVLAEIFLGWGDAFAGKADGLARARQALDRVMSSIMAGPAAPLFALAAEAALTLGEHAQGLRIVAEGLALMERNHGRHLQADLLLLRGELFRRSGRDDEARASIVAALEIAVDQGSPLFELRAAVALLRLAGEDQSRLPQLLARARTLLGTAGEGAELAVHREARALLAALAA